MIYRSLGNTGLKVSVFVPIPRRLHFRRLTSLFLPDFPTEDGSLSEEPSRVRFRRPLASSHKSLTFSHSFIPFPLFPPPFRAIVRFLTTGDPVKDIIKTALDAGVNFFGSSSPFCLPSPPFPVLTPPPTRRQRRDLLERTV